MRNANLLFINFGALLLIIAFCFAVGYGMAVLVVEILFPAIGIVIAIVAVIVVVGLLLAGGRGNDV